jgi:hypothetical protein
MSHFIKCDRCGTQDSVLGTVSLPPGWQKVCNSDLCEPCCQIVRDFIRFRPSDAAALPVEPIPEDTTPLEPSKDKLFETAPEVKPNEEDQSAPAPAAENQQAPSEAKPDKSAPTAQVMGPAPVDETSTEERARTRKSRKLRGQDAILPDPRKPSDPPPPGVQP